MIPRKPSSGFNPGLGYNLRLVRFSTMIRLFFVLYCFEAGLLLLFAPWFREWDQVMMQIVPFEGLRSFLLHAWVRGAITGFGLVHLVWGAHDLIAVLTRRPVETAALEQDRDRQAHDVPVPGDQ